MSLLPGIVISKLTLEFEKDFILNCPADAAGAAKILADNNNIAAASKINIPMRWFSLVLFIRLFLLESS